MRQLRDVVRYGLLWLLLSLVLGLPAAPKVAADSSVTFVKNVGQFDERVLYQIWHGEGFLWLTADGLVWQPDGERPATLAFSESVDPHSLRPIGAVSAEINYLNRAEPVRNVPSFSGIELALDGQLVTFTGHNGRLAVQASQPPAWQALNGASSWGVDRFTWTTERGTSLIIDRVAGVRQSAEDEATLIYSTFIGGITLEEMRRLDVDSTGNAYITGYTQGDDFPVTSGAVDETYNGGSDAFVIKLDPTGSNLVYATFLGGSGNDRGYDLAVNSDDSVTLTGWTRSDDFPVTPGAAQPTYGGEWDSYVVELDPTGSALTYATYIGGSSNDRATGVTVNQSSGVVWLTGWTRSEDFPVSDDAYDTTYSGGSWDSFLLRLGATGSNIIAATYIGGDDSDVVRDVKLDGSNRPYIAGHTASVDFPTTDGAFDTSHNGVQDLFIASFNAALTTLRYSTFLGGGALEEMIGIDVGDGGDVFVSGWTQSANFPVTSGAYVTSFSGRVDGIVAHLSADGGSLLASTFLGGSDIDRANAVYLDDNVVHVIGSTNSADFPVTGRAYDATHNGGTDAFYGQLNLALTRLYYSSFFGGAGNDTGNDAAFFGNKIMFAGQTDNQDFPTTAGAYDGSFNGYDDAYITQLELPSDIAFGATVFLPFTTNEISNSAEPVAASDDHVLYLSFAESGTIGGVQYAPEDIVTYDASGDSWSLLFDGSDIGLDGHNVNGLLRAAGKLVISLDATADLGGAIGIVEPTDLLIFFDTSLGDDTAGFLRLVFDGSDVQLDDAIHDLDAIAVSNEGLLLTNFGADAQIDDIGYRAEDLFELTSPIYWKDSAGDWQFAFDGTDVEVGAVPEKPSSLHVDGSGTIYMTVKGEFDLGGIMGSNRDIFVCDPSATGNTTICTHSVFLRGDELGLEHAIDALDIDFLSTSNPTRLNGLQE